MTVNFHSVNFAPKYNLKAASNVNFNGRKRTASDFLTQINALGELEPSQRANALNTIAIDFFNNPVGTLQDGKNLVQAAIVFVPQEDTAHSASKYIVEVLRLAKYAANDPDFRKAIQDALAKKEHNLELDKAVRGFETSTRNILGMAMDMNTANGYGSKPRFPRRIDKQDKY